MIKHEEKGSIPRLGHPSTTRPRYHSFPGFAIRPQSMPGRRVDRTSLAVQNRKRPTLIAIATGKEDTPTPTPIIISRHRS